jgi:isocitrate dehydrogenase
MDMTEKSSARGTDIEHFEKLVARTKELFERSAEKSRASLENALETAKKEMVAAGAFTTEKGEQLRGFVMRDLAFSRDELESAVRGASHGLNPERIGYGVLGLLQSLAASAGEALSDMAESLKAHRTYRTGEICGPGTLTCDKCGGRLTMSHTGHVPPCAKCKNTEFSRSY